jgi:signal transduction histidine kinase
MRYYRELDSIYSILRRSDLSSKKYKEILQICNAALNNGPILLYKLNIALSQYELIANINIPQETPKAHPYDIHIRLSSGTRFYIKDFKELIIGWLGFPSALNFNEDDKAFIDLICAILSCEYENDWISNLLSKIITPVKLSLPEKDYYHEICKVVGEASGMKYAALRKFERSEEALECIAVYGKNIDTKNIPLDHITFYKDNQLFDLFIGVMNGASDNCIVCNVGDNPVISEITKFELFSNVKTVVITPLVVGDKPLGTVSFGIEHNMEFTSTQKMGFLSISNSVGAAISNYLETATALDYQRDFFEEFRQAVNEEVVQGLRHSIKNSLHNMFGLIRNLEKDLKNKKYNQLNDILEELIGAYDKASIAVDAQASVAISNSNYSNRNLITVFEKALELTEPSLSKYGIKIKYQQGKSFTAYIDEDSLMFAFLNLILNSIDALKRENKRGRHISLNVTPTGDRYKLIFADSGCGFIQKPPEIMNPRDIWKPGATTKKNGTGYGLPYVNAVIQDKHRGTIKIFKTGDSNSGMAFEIELFKDFREYEYTNNRR